MLLRATCVVLLTSVFLSTVLTDENLFGCDFEHDFCGLYQNQNDDFDWTRQTGSTAIGSTVPHLDHTLMSQEGHYALTETKSTQVHSNIARLVMPQVSPGDETICLEFYHSMYDSGVGELDVYVKPGDGITMHSVWTKEIDQGNSWLSAEIQIQLQSRFQIILEGHVGDGVTGNIAVDDISLRCGSCNNPEIVVTGDTIATGGTDLPQDISEWSSGDDLVCPSYNIQWTSYYTTDETSTEESTVEPTSWPYWWTPTPEPYICGQTFYLSYFWDGVRIDSPNYPSNYPNNARCTWIVHASYSWRNLDVWWNDFCTESCCDFVSAGDGNVPGQNVVLNQHSGCSTPSSFYSSGDTVWITFTSDSSITNRGFRVYVNDVGPTEWPSTGEITTEDYRTTADVTTEEATTSPEITTRDWWWQTTDDRWRTTPYWWDTTPGTYECGETYYLSYWDYVRIDSPNYPSNYPNNARCTWIVHAAASWRYLSIWWDDFCTESCCDFVSAGNGNVPGQNVVLNQHSGCSTPSYFYSSGDTIWITFTSDSSITNRGFRVYVDDIDYYYTSESPWITDEITTDVTTEEATTSQEVTTRDWWWQTTDDRWRTTPNWWDTTPGTYDCGETYYLSYWSYVRIESPNYPSNYPNNARCTWVVHAAASWRYLDVYWSDFCTESCCDFVSAGNGGTPGQNVVINQHSGCSIPQHFYSSGDTVWITFTSDGSVTNKGFRVYVYEIDYWYSSEMPWTTDDYRTAPAETTEEPTTWPEETTRDWWWQTTPDWWRTTQDWLDTSPGIYTCGDTYQLSYYGSINIDSPNYPSNYPNNARCVWIVQAAYSWRNIYVDWSDFCTESCCDHVSAGNGNTPGNNVIIDQHAGCGVYPQSFMSSWDTVWLTFYSDSSVTNRGFRVNMYDTDYYSTEMPWTTNEETTSAPEQTTPDWWWHTTPNWWDTTPGIYDCGQTFYLSPWSSARIETPYYPGNYPNNARCVWFVHAAYSWGYIYVSWNDFCTEECCDFVSAGNGDVPGQNAVINQHSGCSRPSNFYSSGDTIWLTFASDGSITNKGFRVYVYDQGSTAWPTTEAEETTVETSEETTRDWWWQTTPYWWDTTPGTCGGYLDLPSWGYVTIDSPNYPSNYPNNARCEWIIKAAYSWRNVYVNWIDFCTESCCDYVSAGNGNSPGNNVVINRHGGCSNPPNFYSSGDTVWLTFYSDSSVTNRGFRVRMYDTEYYPSTDTPWTTEATGSCVGYCGSYNPVDGCYCDSVCETAGDCCPDYAEVCPNVTVTCAKTSMKIDINRSILGGMDEDDLQLIDPICSGSSNVSHITFETTHAACGTTFSETSHHIIYQNTVSNRFADEDVIRRLREVEIPFQCVYSRKGRADASFVVDSEKLYLTETGHGNFSFNLDFYHDVSYGTPYYDYEYPIQVNLGERIYVGAAVETNTTDLELFLEKCKGTPTENPNHSTQYVFIENGCINDATVQLHSVDNPAEKHFSIEAFDFVESNSNLVYIHCDMLVCNATDPFSRCQQGCVLRHRRDVGEDSSLGSRTVTQGPINLYRGDIGIVHGLSQGKKETVVENTGQSIMIYAAMAVFVMGSAMAVAAILYAHHFKRKMKAQVQHA